MSLSFTLHIEVNDLYIHQLIGMVMVKRDWTRDQKHAGQAFANIKRDQQKIWLISYLEGTRLGPEKVKAVSKNDNEHIVCNVTQYCTNNIKLTYVLICPLVSSIREETRSSYPQSCLIASNERFCRCSLS